MVITNNDYQYMLETFVAFPNEMEEMKEAQKSKTIWIVAMIVSTVILGVGVGGFGIAGLLHSYGFQLPQSLQWLTPAIGTIGNTSQFAGLWAMGIGGGALALGILVAGVIRVIHHTNEIKLKKFSLTTQLTEADAQSLFDAMQNTTPLYTEDDKKRWAQSETTHIETSNVYTKRVVRINDKSETYLVVKTHRKEIFALRLNDEANLERILNGMAYTHSPPPAGALLS